MPLGHPGRATKQAVGNEVRNGGPALYPCGVPSMHDRVPGFALGSAQRWLEWMYLEGSGQVCLIFVSWASIRALKKCLSNWKEAAVHLVEKTVIIDSKIRASKPLELFIAGVRVR